MASPPLPDATHRPAATRSDAELWLLRPGSDVARCAFTARATDLWLAPPGGAEERWALALAGAVERVEVLRAPRAEEDEESLLARAFPAALAALARAPRVVAVVELAVLRAIVAGALGIPPGFRAALEIGPGRAVLLRGDALGLVLRRANVLAPEEDSGSALPRERSGRA